LANCTKKIGKFLPEICGETSRYLQTIETQRITNSTQKAPILSRFLTYSFQPAIHRKERSHRWRTDIFFVFLNNAETAKSKGTKKTSGGFHNRPDALYSN
jgi:hypothetical protein